MSPFYDSMIAQVIVHAADRDSAIEKLLDYLGASASRASARIFPLLKRVLADSVFRAGKYDTDYLPQLLRRIDAQALIREIEESAGQVHGSIGVETIRIADSEELKVLSPSTAIFYTTPTPTEPEYVNVGDRIRVADMLAQLEAMKLFTPLKLADFNSETALYDVDREYEITRINMATGQQVNAGDLLFVVKPV